MKHKSYLKVALILLGFTMMMFSNCDLEDETIVSPEDSAAAVAKVNEANAAMEEVMNGVFNAEPDSVQEMLDMMDFSVSSALYAEAQILDPNNLDANFGVAFTGFLMISQDNDLRDMLLSWESYFNANEPFEVSNTLPKRLYQMPFSLDGIKFPVTPMIQLPFAMAKMSVDDVPQFNEFQALVSTLFLPAIERSIDALAILHDNPDYVFMLSAAMQGENEADPMELDQTEFYVIEAGLYGLKGLLNTVVAYNFDFASFDSMGIVTELAQGSDFATLSTDGSGLLNVALISARTAFDMANHGLDFLEEETDDQSNDLIQIDNMTDFQDARTALAEAQSALDGPTMFHYTNSMETEDSVEVDISEFFQNPITDFKAMLPPYTMGTQLEYTYDYITLSEHVNAQEAQVDVEGLNDAYLSISFNYYLDNGAPVMSAIVNLGFLYYDLSNADPTDLPTAVWDLYAEFSDQTETYTSELYLYPQLRFNWGGSVTTGASLEIDGEIYIEYEELAHTYVVPAPSWVADNYADWLAGWPDPTMHNIFPNLDAAGLADLLEITESDWQQF